MHFFQIAMINSNIACLLSALFAYLTETLLERERAHVFSMWYINVVTIMYTVYTVI